MDLLDDAPSGTRTTEIKISGPVQVETPEITEAELVEASRDAGLVILDRKKIKGLAKVGKYLKEAGFLEVKRGRLTARFDALERARKVMLRVIESEVVTLDEEGKPAVMIDSVLAATNALVAIVSEENRSDELDLQMEKKVGVAAPLGQQLPTNQIPPPNVPFVAINNQHNHYPVAPPKTEVGTSG